jgi:hypothetical protein
MVLLGFFATIAGAALIVVFGADGAFRLESGLHSSAHAIVFDGLALRGLRPEGAWAATLSIEASSEADEPLFVGVAPREAAGSFLRDAVVDRVVQLRPVGGLDTERAEGPSTRREPGPPADQTFWVASDGGDPAQMGWTAASGDWAIVVMRADGRQRIDGTGVLTLTIPALGPLGFVALLAGLLLMGGGSAFVISAARTLPRRAPEPGPAPSRPDV